MANETSHRTDTQASTQFPCSQLCPGSQDRGFFFTPICTFCVDSYCIPINSILFSDYTIQHEVEENEAQLSGRKTS